MTERGENKGVDPYEAIGEVLQDQMTPEYYEAELARMIENAKKAMEEYPPDSEKGKLRREITPSVIESLQRSLDQHRKALKHRLADEGRRPFFRPLRKPPKPDS
jgi:hypothetical protein